VVVAGAVEAFWLPDPQAPVSIATTMVDASAAAMVVRLIGSPGCPLAYFDERQTEAGEGVPQRPLVVTEAVAQTFDDGGEGVDGELGLGQVGLLLVEVQGGELEQTDAVVGDHHHGRRLEKLALHLGHAGGQLLLTGLGPVGGSTLRRWRRRR
jgi:hypothetical protein